MSLLRVGASALMVLLYVGEKFSIPGWPDEKVIHAAGFNWTVYVQRRSWIIRPPEKTVWPYPAIVEEL